MYGRIVRGKEGKRSENKQKGEQRKKKFKRRIEDKDNGCLILVNRIIHEQICRKGDIELNG